MKGNNNEQKKGESNDSIDEVAHSDRQKLIKDAKECNYPSVDGYQKIHAKKGNFPLAVVL